MRKLRPLSAIENQILEIMREIGTATVSSLTWEITDAPSTGELRQLLQGLEKMGYITRVTKDGRETVYGTAITSPKVEIQGPQPKPPGIVTWEPGTGARVQQTAEG